MIEMPGMKIRRRDKRVRFVMLGIFAMVFLFTFLVGYVRRSDVEVEAASLDGFDAGYIISDWQMGRYDAMSEVEIQEWLTMMNSCGNTNYDYYLALSAGSVAKWHFSEGHFVCLSEELFGDGEAIGEGETAAHIIWQAAQDYKINPQVLLVLLQKETGLITDPIPNNYDYRKATGYGCPDTAACSSKYYGFKNQIRNAAALFRTVLDGGWTNYPLGENYIQYNPSYECGGSVVNIRSLATSALYRYTPYQPNEGALAAGYGTAYCGAYGNRNFYLYFEDWFGGIKEHSQNVSDADNVDNTDNTVNVVQPVASTNIEDGEYIIKSAVDSSKTIDVAGAGVNDGTNIQIWTANGTDAQKWKIVRNDDGTYTIVSPATGKVLDIAGANMSAGTNVQLWESNNSCAQRWDMKEDSGYFIFVSACSEMVLDVAGAGVNDGTNIQIWTANGTDAQKWKIEILE